MQTVFVERTTDDRMTVAEGTFDRVNAEDNWADLVVIAQVSLLLDHSWEPKVEYWSQAFHWRPDYEKATQEFPESSNLKAR